MIKNHYIKLQDGLYLMRSEHGIAVNSDFTAGAFMHENNMVYENLSADDKVLLILKYGGVQLWDDVIFRLASSVFKYEEFDESSK